jgi:hypothetical protein
MQVVCRSVPSIGKDPLARCSRCDRRKRMVGLAAINIPVGSLPFNDTALPNRSVAASRFERPRKPRFAGFEYASQVIGHGIQHERRMCHRPRAMRSAMLRLPPLSRDKRVGSSIVSILQIEREGVLA